MINPSVFVQSLVSSVVDCPVYGTVPAKVSAEFVTHRVVSSQPVTNGPVSASERVSLAVSVVAGSNDRARILARAVLGAFERAYEGGASDIAFFDVEMLPVLQGSVQLVTDSHSFQYDALYTLIFTE